MIKSPLLLSSAKKVPGSEVRIEVQKMLNELEADAAAKPGDTHVDHEHEGYGHGGEDRLDLQQSRTNLLSITSSMTSPVNFGDQRGSCKTSLGQIFPNPMGEGDKDALENRAVNQPSPVRDG